MITFEIACHRCSTPFAVQVEISTLRNGSFVRFTCPACQAGNTLKVVMDNSAEADHGSEA